MKPSLRRLIPNRIKKLLNSQAALEQRLITLEEGRQNRRYAAAYDTVDYLVGAQIQGDYCEFGVYLGNTFIHVNRLLSSVFPNMRYFAFDSFEGLPHPENIDALDGFTSNFHENEFSCSEMDFITNLKKNHIDMGQVKAIKGWFDQTLVTGKAKEYGIDKIAFAWIDCDLYESTVPVLKFILPHLSVGSVIIFDDWRCFRNLPEFGEQRACREWLTLNPQLTLHELFSFGSHGLAFTVGSY